MHLDEDLLSKVKLSFYLKLYKNTSVTFHILKNIISGNIF